MSLPPAAYVITPAEAKSLTGGSVNPVETALAAWRTALANLKDKASETFTAAKRFSANIPGTKIIKNIRMMPMPIIPDLQKEYIEEFNKKKDYVLGVSFLSVVLESMQSSSFGVEIFPMNTSQPNTHIPAMIDKAKHLKKSIKSIIIPLLLNIHFFCGVGE